MEKLKYKCKCGSIEFITDLNSYDVYEFVGTKLGYIKTELIDDKINLYCRDCGEILDDEKYEFI